MSTEETTKKKPLFIAPQKVIPIEGAKILGTPFEFKEVHSSKQNFLLRNTETGTDHHFDRNVGHITCDIALSFNEVMHLTSLKLYSIPQVDRTVILGISQQDEDDLI